MQVESSAIQTVDYDPARRRLTVRFTSGEAYAYDGVPAGLHRSFAAAESKGRFFSARIRDRFPFHRLASQRH
jgi:lysyl-tRNA synthetase class 2